ncbi:class I SAM-dependent methyltransferase [Streptomyces salyersiae]|uniref:Class I SAM-dependent methyltransferase n=1 Tax=Streptomyces salyersiae TaxID=3075530 RepID=A0ABU2RNI3_9ACTN|nr:class I SAM-dependent methyltransferase [Streptomyces sp. DSM 41770]MDT0430404.1 class I SAM-dependent methyltransferase [Streptomyces sp. DSM 41770]
MRQSVNVRQQQAWNGYEGEHWARNQERWDAVNEGFNAPLLDDAAILPADSVLDIGCGAGATTRLGARRAAEGRVTGVDLSGPMLDRARTTTRAEHLNNVTFEQGDAQVHPLAGRDFDVAISRYGVMFFADPVAAFTNIGGGLRPGGRMVFICAAGAEGNEWLEALASLRDCLPVGDFGATGRPGMFSLADPTRVEEVLKAAAFTRFRIRPVEGHGRWGQGAGDAADFLLDSGPGRNLLQQVDTETGDRARRRLTETLRPYEDAQGVVRMRSSAWLVTAERP